ncbi:dTDP-4-dehydrorhamnose reductase [Candidatus Woesearchaeota archaeon]|nr:dTDP-4-dehydrorhamnose reductase [Candidatus Woesearchaeota archaeon]
MKILVTGCEGMLGKEMCETFKDKYEIIGVGRECDITTKKVLEDKINEIKPEIIINSAAYTNVDLAETEREQANLVNVIGVKNLAELCNKQNIKLIHFSTDYIFDGLKDEPYIEEDKPNPLNHYGFTKLIGERMIQEAMSKYYIFRITWLYGKYRKNFVKTILKLASEKDELKIVNDQTGCPTYTKDVINAVDEAIKQNKNKFGIYHLNNSDSCSWFEFANEILDIKGIEKKLIPIKTEEYPLPAKRPKYSVMSNFKFQSTFKYGIRSWHNALKDFLTNDLT